MVPLNWPLRAPAPQDMRWLGVEDASAVAASRNAALAMADRLGFPAAQADRLGLAVTEAASNLHKHAQAGSLLLCVNRDCGAPGTDLVTIDSGPGVKDVSAAMRDGHSTAGTPAPDGGLDPERLYQVELIKNSGTVLLTLVNDLLDVAKAESGQLRIDPATVNLRAVFGRLRGLIRPMAEGKPVDVIVSEDGVPERLLTDEVALTSILRNLLSNGVKYTDTGQVRLSARVTGDTLRISVSDTGIGIPVDLHQQVFEEFYQVPGPRRGGTGLGLPYARRLAGILGGDLELISDVGAGTTVVLTLPYGTPALGTVLVADDDPGFRRVLTGLLAPMTDRLVEAGDGRKALELLASHPVDMVLADMRMPGLDGAALLARLPDAVPAIIITGADVPRPPRAAALLRKDELTREQLEFTIRAVLRRAR